jgi:hypothetical protein
MSHDHPQYAIIKARHPSKVHLQAFFGTVAKFGEQLPVVREINLVQNRDVEDKLSMKHWIVNVVGDVFTELNHFFGISTRAKAATLA